MNISLALAGAVIDLQTRAEALRPYKELQSIRARLSLSLSHRCYPIGGDRVFFERVNSASSDGNISTVSSAFHSCLLLFTSEKASSTRANSRSPVEYVRNETGSCTVSALRPGLCLCLPPRSPAVKWSDCRVRDDCVHNVFFPLLLLLFFFTIRHAKLIYCLFFQTERAARLGFLSGGEILIE